jgi:hypothetical protein
MTTLEIIATGKNAETSATFSLDAGESTNVFLKDIDTGTQPEMVAVEIGDDQGGFAIIAILGEFQRIFPVFGPGVFRARRFDALRIPCGVCIANGDEPTSGSMI